MRLGENEIYHQVERLRRKRLTRVVVCLVFFSVFLLFVGGTFYSLTTPDYPWDAGELAADIAIIAVSLALAVYVAVRAVVFGRRAKALIAMAPPRQLSWLPPAGGGDGGAELEAQTKRLRTTSLRAMAVCAAWIVVLLAGVGAFVLLDMTGQRLLDRGKSVPATIVSVHNARRGADTITVSYPLGGTTRTVTINRDWNSDLEYTPGQAVTVVYDPADPQRVRTVEERNDDQLVTWSGFVLVIVACIGNPMSVLSARGWRLRYRAVRATGWRKATADVVQPGKSAATMIVKYRDRSIIDVKSASWTLHAPQMGVHPDVSVWVGGEDQHMVVILPRGRWQKGLHAVPVKAEGARWKP